MNTTTIFLQSLLRKYEHDPVRKQKVLDFIQTKIDGEELKQREQKKYNICDLFKRK